MKGTRNRATALILISFVAVWASSAWGIGSSHSAREIPMLQASPGLTPTAGFADPAFQRVWQRTDLPIQTGQATDRSWMWGPQGRYAGYEALASPEGRRLVEYFDKSRMEINDPKADPNSPWYITNGLLVVEMMSGQISLGEGAGQPYVPANVPVAGDVSSSVNAPTYASMASVASLNGNNRAADHTGQPVQTSLGRNGQQSQVPNLSGYAKNAVYEPTLGHNIPDVFWTFLNQSGVVYVNGQYVTDTVIDWTFAMGYPITEAYWINISVGGTNTWVLAQAYQRRILTYSPNNPSASQVEMGNVGLSYYDWRYNGVGAAGSPPTPIPPAPVTPVAPTPKPASPASITINPQEGPANSTVNVSGSNFPPYAAVIITALAPDIGYNQTLMTAAADAAGNFQVAASLPSEVAHQTSVTITALANGNTIQASQQFNIVHNPTFTVSPSQVTNVGVVQLKGDDFPANTDVNVTAYLKNPNGTESPATSGKATTDGNGSFSMSYQLMGKSVVGQQFDVVATAPGNIKVSAKPYVSIVAGASAQVIPSSGPVGVAVTFQGANWQPNRLISITLQGSNGQTQTLPNAVVTNGAGSFSTQVGIPTAYAGQPYVVLWATDSIAQITMQATYTIIQSPSTPVPPTPVPPKPTAGPPATPPAVGGLPMSILENTYSGVTSIVVKGTGWPPSTQLNASVVSSNNTVNTPVGSVTSKSDGTFQISFNQDRAWFGRSDIGVTVSSVNGTAKSTLLLPSATSVKAGGATYSVTGYNWPRNSKVIGYAYDVNGKSEKLASANTDANGNFVGSFDIPQDMKSSFDTLSVQADGQPYEARFGP